MPLKTNCFVLFADRAVLPALSPEDKKSLRRYNVKDYEITIKSIVFNAGIVFTFAKESQNGEQEGLADIEF